MRAFVAIPVPEAAALEAVQGVLDVGRAVAPENWHVTLAFLGDQPEAVLAELHDVLAGIVAPGFGMRLKGVEVYGGRVPALLAAGVEPSAALTGLRKKVRGAARTVGIELSRERFRPHVTLARFRRHMSPGEMARIGRVLEAHGDLAGPEVPVDRFALFRSHLSAAGADYEPLAEYRLRGG